MGVITLQLALSEKKWVNEKASGHSHHQNCPHSFLIVSIMCNIIQLAFIFISHV